VSAAFATFAVGLDRMALWQVVRACVADFKLTGTPLPCLDSMVYPPLLIKKITGL
jgi:hypothetical protein